MVELAGDRPGWRNWDCDKTFDTEQLQKPCPARYLPIHHSRLAGCRRGFQQEITRHRRTYLEGCLLDWRSSDPLGLPRGIPIRQHHFRRTDTKPEAENSRTIRFPDGNPRHAGSRDHRHH